eukprot:163334-Pelagomonas_calceolata.AAC.1
MAGSSPIVNKKKEKGAGPPVNSCSRAQIRFGKPLCSQQSSKESAFQGLMLGGSNSMHVRLGSALAIPLGKRGCTSSRLSALAFRSGSRIPHYSLQTEEGDQPVDLFSWGTCAVPPNTPQAFSGRSKMRARHPPDAPQTHNPLLTIALAVNASDTLAPPTPPIH